MTGDEFETFLRRQPPAPDWEKRKADWLHQVDTLYLQIESSLRRYADKGLLSLSRQRKIMKEDLLGAYDTDVLNVQFADKLIRFDPKGSIIIGGFGRVDVIGPAGRARLILTDSEVTEFKISVTVSRSEPKPAPSPQSPDLRTKVWKIVTAGPNISFHDLTEDSIRTLIEEVAGG